MKNKKIIISLLLSMLVMFSAAACADEKESETQTTSAIQATTASQKPAKTLSAKARNAYRLNYYAHELDEFKPNENGDYMIYPKAPYYDILDSEYVEYTSYADYELYDFVVNHEKRVRKSKENPDWQISDCKGGVCIHKFTGKGMDIKIPETLDGEKVVKLGYDVYNGEADILLESPFENSAVKTITLPSGLRDIVDGALIPRCVNEHLARIEVSKDNPYYTSVDGILYTKDKSCLLYIPFNYPKSNYEVPEGTKAVYSTTPGIVKIPESVISFGEDVKNYSVNRIRTAQYETELAFDSNAYVTMWQVEGFEVAPDNKYYSSEDGVLYNKDKTVLVMYPTVKSGTAFTIPDSVRVVDGGVNFGDTQINVLTFGRNVRECYANCSFPYFENRKPEITIRGYKGTPAQKIAEENEYKYVALD